MKRKRLKLLIKFGLSLTPLLLWVIFRNGPITLIDFKFSQTGDGVEVGVDGNDLGRFELDRNQDIGVSVSMMPNFTREEVKQEYLDLHIVGSNKQPGQLSLDSKQEAGSLAGKTIRVKIQNLEQTGVHLVSDETNKKSVYLRPLRENDWSLAETVNGEEKFIKIENHVPLNPLDQLRRILMILTLAGPGLTLMLLLKMSNRSYFKLNGLWNGGKIKVAFLTIVFIASFGWLFYLNQHYLEGIPHVGDAVAYLMQAKFLAKGGVCSRLQISQEHFDFFKSWGPLSYTNNRWCGAYPYPYGHPLALAVGVLIGIPGIVGPILGAMSVVLLILIGGEIGGGMVGAIAGLFMLASPLFQMNSASFMSHTTAVFYELVAVYALLKYFLKRNILLLLVSGIFWGLLINTRMFTAIGVLVPVLIYLIRKRVGLGRLVLFFGVWGLGALSYFAYNYLNNGSLMGASYLQSNMKLFTQGDLFWTNYLLVVENHLLFFLHTLHGWGYGVSVFLFFWGAMVYWKNKEVFWVITMIAGIILMWGLYDGGTYAFTYGPRYWLEIVPFVCLIFSLSFTALIKISQSKTLKAMVGSILFMLVVYTTSGWIKGKPELWSWIGFTPSKVEELKGFNFTDARLIYRAKEMKISQALIFVKECSGWWCYGSVLAQNKPTLDGDIVWAVDLKERNYQLEQLYPDRKYYLADYDLGIIVSLEKADNPEWNSNVF